MFIQLEYVSIHSNKNFPQNIKVICQTWNRYTVCSMFMIEQSLWDLAFKENTSPENFDNIYLSRIQVTPPPNIYTCPIDLPKIRTPHVNNFPLSPLFNRTIIHKRTLQSTLVCIYIFFFLSIERTRIALESFPRARPFFIGTNASASDWITVTTNRSEMENRAYGRYVAPGKRQINRDGTVRGSGKKRRVRRVWKRKLYYRAYCVIGRIWIKIIRNDGCGAVACTVHHEAKFICKLFFFIRKFKVFEI